MREHVKLFSAERDRIAYWYAIGVSIREIARRLLRSPSSVSTEIKRNRVDGIYHSIRAQRAAEARNLNSHKKYLLNIKDGLRIYVVEKLESRPIAGPAARHGADGARRTAP